MGKNISVKAIVLRVQTIGESDRLCTLLTDRHGVITAFARNAQSIKNKNFAATNQFVYGQFQLYQGKGKYMIDETDYEELHIDIRNNIERLALGQYLCELASVLAPKEENGSDFLRLLKMAFSVIGSRKRPMRIIKAATEMRMVEMAGYMPDLIMCAECGEYEADEMYFMPRSGIIRCKECGPSENIYVKMSRGALAAFRHTIYVHPGKIYSFELSEESTLQLCEAAEAYLREKLEISLKTHEFLKTILP